MKVVLKKPLELEAVQYANNDYGDNPYVFRAPVPDWVQAYVAAGIIKAKFESEDYWYVYVNTRHGLKRVGPDDWIINDYTGELHACSDEVFRSIYSPAP